MRTTATTSRKAQLLQLRGEADEWAIRRNRRQLAQHRAVHNENVPCKRPNSHARMLGHLQGRPTLQLAAVQSAASVPLHAVQELSITEGSALKSTPEHALTPDTTNRPPS